MRTQEKEPDYRLETPTVHLNGTSISGLISQYRESYAALGRASEVMRQAAPHMRDYYILGEPKASIAFKRAQHQHQSRLNRCLALMAEYADMSALLQGRETV